MIVIVWPYGFRTFDWDRLELEELEKYAEVLVHELVEALTPHFAKVYAERLQNEKIDSFATVRSWAKKFKLLTSDIDRQIIVLNFVRMDSLKHVFVNWVLKKSHRKIVDYCQPGVPSLKQEKKFLHQLFNRASWYENYCRIRLHLCICAGELLKIYPNYRFVAGRFYENVQGNYCETRRIKMIRANTWDYSRIVRLNYQSGQNIKYAVLLDGAGPMFLSDALLKRQKVFFTSDVWYPALNQFLKKLEQVFGLTIKIAAHPKTKHVQFPEYFDGREVISEKTAELVVNADFVITRESTAVSYAVEFVKPIIFIYSDQLMADPESMSGIIGMATELGTKAVNINGHLSNEDLEKLCTVNLDVYKKFKENYLTSRFDRKPNYQILLDEMVNV